MDKFSMVDFVREKDRLNAVQVTEYLKNLVEWESKIEDPIDEIQSICQKILAWKKTLGADVNE